MSIGDMRHVVMLQDSVKTPDGAGGYTEVWQDLADAPQVFAAVVVLSAGERLRFRQLEVRATHRFVMRYRPDVKAGMRLVYQGMSYRIFSASDREGRAQYLDILGEQDQL